MKNSEKIIKNIDILTYTMYFGAVIQQWHALLTSHPGSKPVLRVVQINAEPAPEVHLAPKFTMHSVLGCNSGLKKKMSTNSVVLFLQRSFFR